MIELHNNSYQKISLLRASNPNIIIYFKKQRKVGGGEIKNHIPEPNKRRDKTHFLKIRRVTNYFKQKEKKKS